MSASLQHAVVCTVQFAVVQTIQLLVDIDRHKQTSSCVTHLEESFLKLCNAVDGDEVWLKADVEI